MKIGVVGCGYWGANLIRNYSNIDGVTLYALADLDEKALLKYKKIQAAKKYYGNIESLLDDAELDAVVIATTACTHYDLALRCLMAGKHVFVEKPLALKTSECQKLISIAKEQERVLMVGHTFIYNAAVRKMKEYIKEGLLGDVYYLYSQRLNLGKVRQDINALWNFAPHDISIILYCLNKFPVSVRAQGMSYLQKGICDVVFMNLGFEDGINANIHISWLDPNKVRRMTVVGSKKMIVYDDVSSDAKIKIYDKGITKTNIKNCFEDYSDFGKFQLIQRAGDILIPKIIFNEPLKEECLHFVESIKNKTTPITDGCDGLRVVKVLEAAQESLEKNGECVLIK